MIAMNKSKEIKDWSAGNDENENYTGGMSKLHTKSCYFSRFYYLARLFDEGCDYYSCSFIHVANEIFDGPKSSFNESNAMFCPCLTDNSQKDF